MSRKIAGSLNEFCNRWCKRERVECDALKDWKLNIFKIIDRRISSIYMLLCVFFFGQFFSQIHHSYLLNLVALCRLGCLLLAYHVL